MKVVKIVFALLVVALVASSAFAQGGRGKGQRGGGFGMGTDVFARFDTQLKDLNLTADQQTKYDALKAEYKPKLDEIKKDLDAVLTPEQVKARDEAIAKAKADGKTGRELAAAGRVTDLTADQRTKQREIFQKLMPLGQEIRTKVMDLLTDEQKAKMPQPGNRGGKKKAAPTT